MKKYTITFCYNGKELDRMHGLRLYDYSARQYDPAHGLFTSIDPLCEKYYHVSPYMYCEGNPVNMVDPDGRRPKPKEAALMAAYSYLDRHANDYLRQLNELGWKISKYSTSITMDYKGGFQNGLQSTLFEKTVDGKTEYVYSYAGTNSLEDCFEDIGQVLGISPQYSQAIFNARQLSKDLGKNGLTFVGHSLGGGEAIASGMATGRSVITFNPASVSPFTILFHQLFSYSYIVNYRTTGELLLGSNIRFGGDPLNNFQDNIGIHAQGKTIPIYIGRKISHGIEAFLSVDLPNK